MSEQKFAVLINADHDYTGSTTSGLEYTLDLDESGYQVEVYFNGSATQWPSTLEDNSENSVNKYYEEVREKGLIGGVCGFCANAYGAYDELDATDIDLLGGREDHGPHAGQLIDDGYELSTVQYSQNTSSNSPDSTAKRRIDPQGEMACQLVLTPRLPS